MGIKKERYIEANSRIDSSIKTKHYFEAITIEESIISDRLASFLVATETLKNEQIYRQSFANLIMLWKLATTNPGSIWSECDTLIQEVDSWRTQRNKYVHGLVKFPHQKPNIVDTKTFITGAQKTATDGKALAIKVNIWRQQQSQIKRKHNNALKRDSAKNAAPLS